MRRPKGPSRSWSGLWIAVIAVVAVGGCTRAFYQRAADREVADILAEKDVNADWKIEQFHVFPDPRARFANPANPNRQPMPPDDAATWKATPHPQGPGHAGIGRFENTTFLELLETWDRENRAERAALADAAKREAGDIARRDVTGRGAIQTIFEGPPDADTAFLINLEQAVQLGVINSREYQFFREDLYLFALPVTQQRFSFVWQWTATETAIRQWAGVNSSAGAQNNWSLMTGAGVGKLFSTGALLTAQFATNTVFNFRNTAVNGGFSSPSTVNLDLVQPLLQGGGKAVTLEPLTQAERNLFYAIRGYARFREQFYTSISYGPNVPSNLSTASGATAGGNPISTLAALGIASTDVAGNFRGYLPSLYRELDKAVDAKYVKDLEKALLLFEGFQEGGQVAPLQVSQVRSTLLQARNAVLKDIQDTTNSLDQFKLQLGIPANVPLALDDTPARGITQTLDRYYEVLANANAAGALIDKQDDMAPEKVRPFLLEVYMRDPLVRGTEFQKKLPQAWAGWVKLNDQELQTRLEQLAKNRTRLLDRKTDLEVKGQKLSAEEARRMSEEEFEADLGGLEKTLRRYEAKPWEKNPEPNAKRQGRYKLFRLTSYSAQVVLVWARNEQVTIVGGSWPTLPHAEVEGLDLLNTPTLEAEEKAVAMALGNRWDLMNARAQVVDAWRQLAVTANALMGVLNVQYHLDSQTPPGGAQPLAFSSAATNQQLIINAQLPLVRVQQRNAYRTALINYERARRSLISLEDNVAAQVRFDVRQLHLFAENYRIQQKVVESLYSQVESSLEVIVAPTDPDSLKASGTAGQANAAALTNQYLSALSSLNNAQTKMYDTWLSYLATRMQLYQDLERLLMDARGVWIDGYGYTPNLSPVPGPAFPQPRGNLDNGAPIPAPGPVFGQPRPPEPAPAVVLLPPVGLE